MVADVSVIIPVFNSEKYLHKCVDSVLNQTYKNFNLLLVDDGSKDDSGRICDDYEKLDNRVKVIHQDNKGQNGAIWAGILEAQTEYLCFVDSDDYVGETLLDKLMFPAKEHNCDLVISCLNRDRNGEISPFIYLPFDEGYYSEDRIKEEIFPELIFSEKLNDTSIPGSRCGKLFRRDVLNRTYYDIKVKNGEDWISSIATITHIKSLYLLPNVREYYYVLNSSSVTHTRNENVYTEWIKGVDYLEKQLLTDVNYDFSKQIAQYKTFMAMCALNSCQRYCLSISLERQISILQKILDDPSNSHGCDYAVKKKKDKIYLALLRRKKVLALSIFQRICAIKKHI